jgi:hypothetical protein
MGHRHEPQTARSSLYFIIRICAVADVTSWRGVRRYEQTCVTALHTVAGGTQSALEQQLALEIQLPPHCLKPLAQAKEQA